MRVAVVIPTLRRPDELERALRSVAAQIGVEGRLSEVVVADNDPEGSARDVRDRLMDDYPVRLIYRHAPRPGVATARNAGLAATDAPLIAFLDDDEAASPGWLAALLKAQASTGAEAVFGPIRGRTPPDTGWATAYLDRFFSRHGPDQDQLIDHPFGCGNSLMLRAVALPGAAPFDTTTDEVGGEDDALFADMAARGGRFGWAAQAWVDEYAPPHRATLRYALIRAFAYGQGPSQAAARRGDWTSLLFWMGIGAAQTLAWGGIWAVLATLRRPSRAWALDRASRGLGKVLWARRFEPRFYGGAELARLEGRVATV